MVSNGGFGRRMVRVEVLDESRNVLVSGFAPALDAGRVADLLLVAEAKGLNLSQVRVGKRWFVDQ